MLLLNYIYEFQNFKIDNLFDLFILLILEFYLSLNGSNSKILMNFYLIKKTQSNYKRNQGNPEKITFNLIEYLKKPIKSIKSIDPITEYYSKMLLFEQKFHLDEILFRFLVNKTLPDLQRVYLNVKCTQK